MALINKLDRQLQGGRRPTRRGEVGILPVEGDVGVGEVDTLPIDTVDPDDTVFAHVKKRTTTGFKNTLDRIGSAVADRVIPVIIEQAINRMLGRIEGKQGEPRREQIEGGAFVLSRLAHAHGLNMPRNQILPILEGHRKGHRKSSRKKLCALARH